MNKPGSTATIQLCTNTFDGKPVADTPAQILEVADQAAIAGGEELVRLFERASIQHPSGIQQKSSSFNLVTDADIASEQAVIKVIKSQFPDHTILGEESGEQRVTEAVNSEKLWVIDPLDVTNNFIHCLPHFAVSVAYAERGVIKAGVVLNPLTGEKFSAVAGGGANRNGRPIHVSEAADLNESLVGVGFYYDRAAQMKNTLTAIESCFENQIHGIRRLGTASLDLCNVACGRFGAYFEFELAPWDFAAGWLMVEEAGGQVTDCLGNPLQIKNSSMLASNRKLHHSMIPITSKNFES